jgi:crotonobetainyl-CoA:carnitine CoA-transferase CaiB-like acyl-CoA transferase
MGRPELASVHRFGSLQERKKNEDEIDWLISEWTAERPAEEVMRILQKAGIAAGAVQNSEDLYFDIQLRAREHTVEIDTGLNGVITFDGPPIHLTDGQKRRLTVPRYWVHRMTTSTSNFWV